MTETMPDLAALTREYSAHNYHPLPVIAATASGAWVTDVAGLRRYPGHARRVLGAELRAPASAACRRRATTARAGHAGEPGVRPRPVRAVLRRARRAVRDGHGPADEHRRRGRRDRDQGGAQVGVRGPRRARRPGDRGGVRRELPRPDHHDRVVLLRPRREGRLRAVHARVRLAYRTGILPRCVRSSRRTGRAW